MSDFTERAREMLARFPNGQAVAELAALLAREAAMREALDACQSHLSERLARLAPAPSQPGEAPAPQPPAEREAPASREAREAPLRRGIDGVCSRSSCECEREGLGPACIWLKPTDAELLRRTGEPHIDGWPLMSGLPRPREAREALEPVAQERRGELAERAGLVWNGHRYVDALAASARMDASMPRELRALASAILPAQPVVPVLIPAGVYYNMDADNFYDADGTGMTHAFYRTWQPRCMEFPRSRLEASIARLADEAPAVPAVRRYFEMPPEARPREPLEKLRFFCSLAMTGQDWLDVEQFFDEVSAALAGAHEAGRREMRHEAAMAAWWLKQQYIGDPDDDGVVHWLSEAEAAIRALPAK